MKKVDSKTSITNKNGSITPNRSSAAPIKIDFLGDKFFTVILSLAVFHRTTSISLSVLR